MNQNEIFYSLLRLSLGIAHDFPADVSADTWQRLYEMSAKQSLVGVCYQGVSQLPPTQQPPLQLAMQWACEAEAIRGMNIQQNEEAARLTQLFAAEGRKTAILKGQANARLYPDKLSRTPGDIDLWVEGGRDSVIALLETMGLMNYSTEIPPERRSHVSYHHVELMLDGSDTQIEVHFRAAPRNFNPLIERQLQRELGQELLNMAMTDEGFCVPSIRYALVMQLAHLRKHLGAGIGLRQLMDYYWLLQNASPDDLAVVSGQIKRFRMVQFARALMWLLREVLYLEERLMLFEPDAKWGEWLLNDTMSGGNFGRFRDEAPNQVVKSKFKEKMRRVKLMHFDSCGILWTEFRFWGIVIKTIPARIKKRTISLSR